MIYDNLTENVQTIYTTFDIFGKCHSTSLLCTLEHKTQHKHLLITTTNLVMLSKLFGYCWLYMVV